MTPSPSRYVWLTPRDRKRDAGPVDDIAVGPDGASARLDYAARGRLGRWARLVLAAAGAGLPAAAGVLAASGQGWFALATAIIGALYAGALRLALLVRARDHTLASHGAFLAQLQRMRVDALRRNAGIAAMRFAQALAARHRMHDACDALAAVALRAIVPVAGGLWLASGAPLPAALFAGAALGLGMIAGGLAERRLLAAAFRSEIRDMAFARRGQRFVAAWPTMRDHGVGDAPIDRLRRAAPIAAAARALRASLRVSALFRLGVPALPIAASLLLTDLPLAALLGTAIAAVAAGQAGAAGGVQFVRAAQAQHRRNAADRLFLPDGGTKPPVGRIETLELRDVSFRYPGAAKPVFEKLDLSLHSGQILALASPSGSGKTTLLRVIAGLAQPCAGHVKINGQDARDLDYRRRIAAVFQDEPIGAGTIRSAIAGGNSIGLDAAWAAAAQVGADEAIRALPMEMQTLIVEGPFPPSLLQPLLIARALAQHADLLVFDEALGSLPHERARALLEALRRDGVIVLFASHDPRLVALADTVLTLGVD